MSLLAPPDPEWPIIAADEIALWHEVCGPSLVTVHHIGSTSVPGLPAKPIIDLLPVFKDDGSMDGVRDKLETIGYEWMGEFGLPGRRYCRKDDPDTDKRLFHAHAYAVGHEGVLRHLVFRDALRKNASMRAAYTSVKAACAARHPDGGAQYSDCKSDWISKAEALALEHQS
ncbi:MAG: GrpB family protein [Paracoccaceae bacterium]